jgi:hypothetical protein
VDGAGAGAVDQDVAIFLIARHLEREEPPAGVQGEAPDLIPFDVDRDLAAAESAHEEAIGRGGSDDPA